LKLIPGQAGDDGFHFLLIPKSVINGRSLSEIKEVVLEYVSKYIGSSKPTGISGLGQTISTIDLSDELTGNEFLSTISSYYGGTFSFSRLPEKLQI
jgi:hypothetical protein